MVKMRVTVYTGKHSLAGYGAWPRMVSPHIVSPLLAKGYLGRLLCTGVDPKMCPRDKVVVLEYPWMAFTILRRGASEARRFASRLGLLIWQYIDLLETVWVDRLASRRLGACDMLFCPSSYSLHTMTAARKAGALVVLFGQWSHIDIKERLLQEECALQGLPYRPNPHRERLIREYASADYIFSPSTFSCQSYVQLGIPREKVVCTPHGVDIDKFHPLNSRGDDGQFTIIFIGSVVLGKGFHYLVRAVRLMDRPNVQVTVFGSISHEIRQFMHSEMGSHGQSAFSLEFRRVGEVASSLRRASVLVLPSIQEAFGLVVLEAMASGIPVIVTEHVGAKDAVRDGVDGYIIPIRDPDAIARRLTVLYDDPERRRDMGRSARSQAEKHRWQVHADGFISAIEQAWQGAANRE
jgi:starch synthase